MSNEEVPQWIINLTDRELLGRLNIPVDNKVDLTTRYYLEKELNSGLRDC